MEPFIAQIMLFGGNFAPRGWAFCNGQLLAISSNTALFSILGTTYGGDGRNTFGLPDLRGRAPIHPGNGPGLSDIRIGQKGGTETTTLNVNNLPSHTHPATFTGTSVPISTPDAGTSSDPTGKVPANSGRRDAEYADPGISANEAAPAGTVNLGNVGGNVAFNNRPPYTAINYIIALQGIFPSRS